MNAEPAHIGEQPSSPTEYSLPPLSLLSSDSSSRRSCLADLLRATDPDYLQIPLGTDENGHPVICNLAETPHILAGSVKGSAGIIALLTAITSVFMRATPEDARFIMIDTKGADLHRFQRIPHLLFPVVFNCSIAALTLEWASAEAARRLTAMKDLGFQNDRLPAIMIFVNDFAHLMLKTSGSVEAIIEYIAKIGGTANIHLIVGTRRCSESVITDRIREGFSCRLCGIVSNDSESYSVLGTPNAETPSSLGEMRMRIPNCPTDRLIRLPNDNVFYDSFAVADYLRGQGSPEYHDSLIEHMARAHFNFNDSIRLSPSDDSLL